MKHIFNTFNMTLNSLFLATPLTLENYLEEKSPLTKKYRMPLVNIDCSQIQIIVLWKIAPWNAQPWPCDGLAGHASSERSCVHAAPRSASLQSSLISSVSDGWDVVRENRKWKSQEGKGRWKAGSSGHCMSVLEVVGYCRALWSEPFLIPFTLFNRNGCYKLYFCIAREYMPSRVFVMKHPVPYFPSPGIPYGSWEYRKNSIMQCSITQQGALD